MTARLNPTTALMFLGLAAAGVGMLLGPAQLIAGSALASEKGAVRVAIQVNENDAKVMNLALNNVANVVAHYKAQGQKVEIQLVTYGPGLHMLRADTSPVKDRIAAMALQFEGLTFVACKNTQANMAKQEGRDVPLLTEARPVPSGVVTLIELQQKGFAYIRP
jgi:uncharacterized protein